jgi:hypothetical protein
MFCSDFETANHLFVVCPFVKSVWHWIAFHNHFHFEGVTLEDIWVIDALIPYKNSQLIEMIRGAVLWTIWLERNKLCFQNDPPKIIKSVGMQILRLVFFWCQHACSSHYNDLLSVMPQEVQNLPLQVNHLEDLVVTDLLVREDHLYGKRD